MAATGSIPAPAGEPPGAAVFLPPRTVYPRACGGTAYPHHLSLSLHGLSPRLRGNLPALRLMKPRRRSIPAPAGEP